MDTLNWVALALIFFVIVLIVATIVCLHMVPGKIARANNHPQLKAIEACSLMGLIIFPFWMVAMVWANFRPPHVMIPDGTEDEAVDSEQPGTSEEVPQVETVEAKNEATPSDEDGK